jgi:hypothetical protein
MNDTGISGQGILMIVVGLWLLLRTVNKDSSGRTLIDHIVGQPAQNALGPAPTSFKSYNAGYLKQQLLKISPSAN